MSKPPPPVKVPPAVRVLARMTGARLCYGKAVSAGGRTVIPVASVRSVGGGGFGLSTGEGQGGGGGGLLDARPVGFIELGPDGTRFERIDDGRIALRAAAAGSLAILVTGRLMTRRRRRRIGAARPRGGIRRGGGEPAARAAHRRGRLLGRGQTSQRS
jgi:uncharacterized spore protein YtfJ